MFRFSGQDEEHLADRTNQLDQQAEDGDSDMMMTSFTSPNGGSSSTTTTNTTTTSSSTSSSSSQPSLSNCSSPQLASPPPPPPPPPQPISSCASPKTIIPKIDMSLENDQNSPESSPKTVVDVSELQQQLHKVKVEPKSDPIVMAALPKLRLNITLASDPALQPEAKDIKGIHADGRRDSNHRQMQHCDLMDDDDDDDENNGADGRDRRSNVSVTPPSPANTLSPRLIPSPLQQQQQPPQPVVIVPNSEVTMGRMPAFMCGPCGIKFSSLSTLEAHQTYYCSHR